MINYMGFMINLITLVISILTCLISFTILIMIIHHLCYNHLQHRDKTIISLCANIYPLVLVSTALTIAVNIQTFLGDIYDWNFNSSWCIFIGYFFTSILSTLYWAFVNQVFRMFNILSIHFI